MNLSLNHIISPNLNFEDFFKQAYDLEIKNIEIRNDLPKLDFNQIDINEIIDLKNKFKIEIISINALQKFNIWNDERKKELISLCNIAQKIDCSGLVLCPLNNSEYLDKESRIKILKKSLQEINPILSDYNIKGFVEPLGFKSCSLRYKSEVINVLNFFNNDHMFSLVHDTFHHVVAQEESIFPNQTGIVHISGVNKKDIKINDYTDELRELINEEDKINNITQINYFIEKGYSGIFSFEPFSSKIHNAANSINLIKQSINYINKNIIN